MKKEKTLNLLREILPLPEELIYVISQFVGKYIRCKAPIDICMYSTRHRRLKYHIKHFVNFVK